MVLALGNGPRKESLADSRSALPAFLAVQKANSPYHNRLLISLGCCDGYDIRLAMGS